MMERFTLSTLFKIVGVKIGGHSLRHTADKHIQAEITHQLTVRGITQRSPVVETLWSNFIVAVSPNAHLNSS